jgi:hypothetical protein
MNIFVKAYIYLLFVFSSMGMISGWIFTGHFFFMSVFLILSFLMTCITLMIGNETFKTIKGE